MAAPSTIYRVSIQLADVDHNRYETLRFTAAQHPSETPERLVARLLAYALSYEEGLTFRNGVSCGDEPDVWLKDPNERYQKWIEVGLPDPERLRKATRQSPEVVVFAYGPARHRWENQHLAALNKLSGLKIYGLDIDFQRQLCAHLERVIDWNLTVTEGILYLTVADTPLESPLSCLLDSP